jgi:hypothetical protein
MKNVLQITLKNQAVEELQAVVKKTKDTCIKVPDFQEATSPLYLEIEHQQINTLLELTKVSPFVLLYFDEKLEFTGASYSLNSYDSPFSISTQSKKILIVHFPIDFRLEDVLNVKFISE